MHTCMRSCDRLLAYLTDDSDESISAGHAEHPNSLIIDGDARCRGAAERKIGTVQRVKKKVRRKEGR